MASENKNVTPKKHNRAVTFLLIGAAVIFAGACAGGLLYYFNQPIYTGTIDTGSGEEEIVINVCRDDRDEYRDYIDLYGDSFLYPGVTVGGVDVGGMSRADALSALESTGIGVPSGDSVTVLMGENASFTVSCEDAYIYSGMEEAVDNALAYCHNGSEEENSAAFVNARDNGIDFPVTVTESINEDYLRSAVADAAAGIECSVQTACYNIDGDILHITKEQDGCEVDEDEVCALLSVAFTNHEYGTLIYEPVSIPAQSLDLQQVYNEVYTEPQNSVYDPATGSGTEGVDGISFSLTDAQELYAAAAPGGEFSVRLIYTAPEIDKETLDSLLFRDVLGEKDTVVSGTAARRNNVSLAAQAVNGIVLNPGEEFNFNEVVGQRTAERGYQAAPAYVSGDTVDQIGGGICQVSSTIYYCVLYGNLEVVERYNHMYAVSYLPYGHDATVSWGGPDFRFKNSTDYPIRIDIEMKYSAGKYRLFCTIYGTNISGNYVKTDYETVSVNSYKTVYEHSDDLAEGKTKEKCNGYTGRTVKVYIYLYDKDGNLLSTQTYTDVYKRRDRVIYTGSEVDADGKIIEKTEDDTDTGDSSGTGDDDTGSGSGGDSGGSGGDSGDTGGGSGGSGGDSGGDDGEMYSPDEGGGE